MPIVTTPPIYPSECGGSAVATVGVEINPSGTVRDSWIENLSDPCFANAAKMTADQYRFPSWFAKERRRLTVTIHFLAPNADAILPF